VEHVQLVVRVTVMMEYQAMVCALVTLVLQDQIVNIRILEPVTVMVLPIMMDLVLAILDLMAQIAIHVPQIITIIQLAHSVQRHQLATDMELAVLQDLVLAIPIIMVQLAINTAMLLQTVLDTVFAILLDNVLVMQVMLVQTVINVH